MQSLRLVLQESNVISNTNVISITNTNVISITNTNVISITNTNVKSITNINVIFVFRDKNSLKSAIESK